MKKKGIEIIVDGGRMYFDDSDEVPIIRFRCYKKSFSVDMLKAKWVNNKPNEKIPDKLLYEIFLDRLESEMSPENFPGLSGYEFMRRLWNVNHYKEIPLKKKMPKYEKLLKDCKDDR